MLNPRPYQEPKVGNQWHPLARIVEQPVHNLPVKLNNIHKIPL